jgi:tRNA (guanine6-N2)-methyltransferase
MFPGMAAVVMDEAQDIVGVRPVKIGRLRNGEIANLSYSGHPKDLLKLRTVEDVYAVVGQIPLSGQTVDLKTIGQAKLWGVDLRRALDIWTRVTGEPLVKRQQFRVVVQADDAIWRHYRRLDIVLSAERALIHAGSSWRLNRDEAPLEIWLQQVDHELLVSVRLTSSYDRQHGGREVERGAALRPNVAAAMVRLAGIDPDDVFLDPMCGTGTILLERAVAGRYKLLLGGDVSQDAVNATLANFGPRHKPWEIRVWDATKLPLADASVSKVVTNLPWGRQISEQSALPSLYSEFLSEAERVLTEHGRIVVLTSEWDLFKKVVHAKAGLMLAKSVSDIEILGRRADIFVLEHV